MLKNLICADFMAAYLKIIVGAAKHIYCNFVPIYGTDSFHQWQFTYFELHQCLIILTAFFSNPLMPMIQEVILSISLLDLG